MKSMEQYCRRAESQNHGRETGGGCLEFLKERDEYLDPYMHFRVMQSDMMADMRESFVRRYKIEVE